MLEVRVLRQEKNPVRIVFASNLEARRAAPPTSNSQLYALNS